MSTNADIRPALGIDGTTQFIVSNDTRNEWGNMGFGGDTLFSVQAVLGVANLKALQPSMGPSETSQIYPHEVTGVKSISQAGPGWAKLEVEARDYRNKTVQGTIYAPTNMW